MKYTESRQIIPTEVTVWAVVFDSNGEQHVLTLNKSALVEDVVSYVKVHYPDKNFRVRSIDCGDFIVGKTIILFSSDNRQVDQDLNLCVQ